MAQMYKVKVDGKNQECVLLTDMIAQVEHFILLKTGKSVKISEPTTSEQLNKLGRAYDYANKQATFYDHVGDAAGYEFHWKDFI